MDAAGGGFKPGRWPLFGCRCGADAGVSLCATGRWVKVAATGCVLARGSCVAGPGWPRLPVGNRYPRMGVSALALVRTRASSSAGRERSAGLRRADLFFPTSEVGGSRRGVLFTHFVAAWCGIAPFWRLGTRRKILGPALWVAGGPGVQPAAPIMIGVCLVVKLFAGWFGWVVL